MKVFDCVVDLTRLAFICKDLLSNKQAFENKEIERQAIALAITDGGSADFK